MTYERKIFGKHVRAIRVTDTEDTYERCEEGGKVCPPTATQMRVRRFCTKSCYNKMRYRRAREAKA